MTMTVSYTHLDVYKRQLLIWEEFAKRYHDRWIIGGYDLLNEPLSGPNCRKLLPELAKFYDDVIPRIRKYDKNHMLTLEGSVFSMDMDIFDHEYDPECHNWCIHIHYYGFSPEVRTLYRFLDASLKNNVPIWIGEGGSDPVSNSVFYEIAGAYDIGYAVWSWKRADDPKGDGSSAVTYPIPEKWDVMRDYIRNGGPRPSYKESQEILDEMLEKMKPEYYTVDRTYNYYNLRQPGIRIPAVGFNQGSTKSNGWIYGNAFGYRTEEGMKMPLRPDAMPPQHVVVPTGEPLRESSPLKDLCLELREGEAAAYTIRDVKETCPVSATVRALGEKASVIVTCTSEEGKREVSEITVTGTETKEYDLASLSEGAEWTISLETKEGTVQLDEVIFAR